MNKKHKRILSLLLCIAMLFTILPTTAIAADATETVGVSTKEALSAALGTGGSGNVVLESDILDITNQLTVGRNVTLDLNGHHMKIFITAGKENGIKIANNVILTIMDSSNPSTGKLEIGTNIKGGYNGYGAGINTTDGTLIIESGTVISNGEVSATGIGGGTGAEGTAGNIIINGGTVIANYIGDSMFLHHNTVTINGGTVKSLFISTPVNSAGEALSLVKLTIPGQPNQFVTAANIGGIDYGIESISTDDDGLLYLWLPASIDGKLITVTVNDIDYGVTYQRPYNGGGVEQTMESAVTSISIENEPIKLTYIEGEALDLTGLKVILNRSDNSSEEVAFHEFISNGIVTTPANGEAVSVSGSAVTITCTLYNKSVSQPIMVIPLDATISPTSISYDLNASDDISTAITRNANSTITDVVYGSVSLPTEAYAVSGNALTIKSSYINGLGVSEGDVLPFIISFDMGKPVTLNVNIVNSYTPSSNALLSHLTVNGNPINEFDPNITEYQMTLPSGTRSVLVGAVSEDPHATVTITKPQSLPGDAIVSVTAEDGITTKNYTIHLTIFQSNVSSGGAGGSTETTSNTPSKETKSIFKSNLPTIGKAYIKAKKGADNSATAVISKKIVANTMAKAQTESVKQGKAEDGISILLSISRPAGTDSLSVVLSQDILTQLTTIEVSTLEIECDLYRLCLDLEAIKEIQKQSTGDITIHIEPVTGLTGDAKTMIGKRPVYNITISYVKKGKTVHITSLGKGNATLSIPYTPGKKENVSHLFGVYVDKSGKATRIESSAYDTNSGSIMFDSNHFSVYGVGYSTPKEKYTDISTHWAKESIDYVAGRGLIDGTTTTTFSPNMAISRGTLVTALGRMAGVDVSKYKTDLFTDVEADQYYAPYMEWAYKNSIISEVSSGKGAPDQAVTREEVALILSNYAKATGYTLPVIREAISFADADLTGSTYKEAVTSMQQAGIVMSRSDSRFSSRSNATRGEVAAMLHRYIKLSIDPATAQGWVVNDAGQRLYYKDGIMVSNSWLEINEKWYYFKTDGSLAVSTKVDGYEVDENGVRRTKENE